jgi:hypothetical protein
MQQISARKIVVVRPLLDVGGRPRQAGRGEQIPGFSMSRRRPSRHIELLVYTTNRNMPVTAGQLRRIARPGRAGFARVFPPPP